MKIETNYLLYVAMLILFCSPIFIVSTIGYGFGIPTKSPDSNNSATLIEDEQSQVQFTETMNPEDFTMPFSGFIENQGQVPDESIRFYYSQSNTSVGFGESEIYLHTENYFFSISFSGSNKITPTGVSKKTHVVNYLLGDFQKSSIPTYDEIWFFELYDGIDLRYLMSDRGLKYEFIVHPQGDLSQICIAVSESIDLDVEDNTVSFYSTNGLLFQDTGLTVFQNNRDLIDSSFTKRDTISNTYGFDISSYDENQDLIIDPWFLAFSSFFGRTSQDRFYDVEVDSSGNVYAAGYTYGSFPLLNYFQTFQYPPDGIIVKVDSECNLIFSTYLGGSVGSYAAWDYIYALDIDDDGYVYVCGRTDSSDFPTKNAFNDTEPWGTDGFVTKLNYTGSSLVYSTYFGGNVYEECWDIEVDSSGCAYVTGYTSSTNFPLKNAYNSTPGGDEDVFISKFTAAGNDLVFSTLLGGSDEEQARGIAVDTSGNCYVTGYTWSDDFTTKNAYDSSMNGWKDAFIAKYTSDGSNLIFSSYLGGSGSNQGYDIDVDSNQRIYVCGYTTSSSFPTTNGYDTTYGGGQDIFLTKFEADGSLNYSTYFGGDGDDEARGMTVGPDDKPYITGVVNSTGYPLANPYDSELGGYQDTYITKLNEEGDTLEFSSYIGGSDYEWGYGVTVDSNLNIYLAGITSSTDYPVIRAYQDTYGGDYHDAYLTKIAFDDTPPEISLNNPVDGSVIRQGMTIDLDVTDDWYVDIVQYNWDGSDNVTLESPFDFKAPSQITKTLNVYANDSAGNEIHESFTIYVSTTYAEFSTYIGGSEGGTATDELKAIALDSEGNCYVFGEAYSTNYPTFNAFNDTSSGDRDLILSKFSSNGTLIYSTYIGGPEFDVAKDIEVDSAGNVYLCGYTKSSTGFPLVNSYNSTYGGGTYDGFIIRLNNAGTSIDFSTYVGGQEPDAITSISLDDSGNIFVVGYTKSLDFPMVNAYNDTKGLSDDAFLAMFNPAGNELLYSTFLGGNLYDYARGLAVDSDGYCYVIGDTASTNFPTQNALNSTLNGGYDIFITKIKPGEPSLNYSTYFGSTDTDYSEGITVDELGNCYFIGYTAGDDYPSTTAYQGGFDLVITSFNAKGDTVLYSSYHGMSGFEYAGNIVHGSDGHIYAIGSCHSHDFPLVNPIDPTRDGATEVLLLKFSLDMSEMEFSTYYGGTDGDAGIDLAVHTDGTIYFTGYTSSTDFPTINAYQEDFAGGDNDGFVARIGMDDDAPTITLENPPNNSFSTTGAEVSLTIEDVGSGVNHVLYYWDSGPNQTLDSPYIENVPSGEGPHTLYVFSNDSVGNWASEVFVLTADNFDPTITLTSPLNNTIQASSTIIDLDIDDTYLNTTLYYWDSDVPVEWLAPYETSAPIGDGTHFLYVFANDTYGHETNKFYIFITDNTLPSITLTYPSNNTVHHSNALIELDVYDLNLEYVLYNWDSAISNSTWLEPYEEFLPSGDGDHILRIYVNDSASNWKIMLYSFTTDDSFPNIDHPLDLTMNEGDLGESISWTPTSSDPSDYYIYRNGSEVDTDAWVSGDPITYSFDGLPYGLYKFSIIIYDGSGNSARDWIWVDVKDGTFPTINQPEDVIYDEGTTGNTIVWNGTDVNPVSYQVLLGGINYAKGAWNDSSEFFVINVDGLEYGEYHFAMILKDVDDNTVVDVVYVTIIDLTPPVIKELDDFTYVVDTTGYELIWIASDRNPTTYEIYLDGTLLGPFGWDGDSISINIDGLTLGTYNYTLRVIDIDNNDAIDTVWVSVVVDETPPTIDDPPDTYYQVGTIGNNLTWTPQDDFPDHYQVFRNGTSIDEDDWNPEDDNITISIDGLPVGLYNFTIIVWDDGGNNVTHTIWVEVVNDTIQPTIDSPNNLSYNEGTTGHSIIWSPNDAYPLNYSIFRDGIEIHSGAWNGSTVEVSIDGLAIGEYNYTINAFDVGGNKVADTVIVTVTDATSPLIDSPSDFSYAEGSTGNSITWTPEDLHPASYIVYRNGTELESDNWTGDPILISIDGIGLGIYNYTIVVFDESENTVIDSVMVTVYDGTPPTIDSPDDIEYEEGETGNWITWTPSDAHPALYRIYLEESEITSEAWTGDSISILVDGLALGAYNYTLVVLDVGGNIASDTVLVTVTSPSATPTTTTTTTTTTTVPPDNIVVIIIVIAGAGGAIVVVIIIFLVKKGKLHLGRRSGG